MRTGIVAVFIVQALLPAKAVWLYRERTVPTPWPIANCRVLLGRSNRPDGSGGWGPLPSAQFPWLLVFEDHLLAAHCAGQFRRSCSLYGTYSLLRAMRLPDLLL
jgi:hypothetical protein